MITRIEIDGFKSFVDFKLDVPPFLAVVGRNTSGKSNLLDAIVFAAAAARGERLSDAVRLARGDPASLFHRRADGTTVERMTFALEFLLDDTAVDGATRWRYECVIGWIDRRERRVIDLLAERFTPINAGADRWPERFAMAKSWQNRRVRYGTAGAERVPVPAIAKSLTVIGNARLWGREPSMQEFPRDEHATKAALNAYYELTGISVLRLEPQDIARPSPSEVDVAMTETGAGFAGWLERLVEQTVSEDDQEGLLRDVRADLTRVIRDVTDVRLVLDDERGDVRLRFETRNDRTLEAPQASDGTLRVTAMLAALHNPERRGLLAIEEPENGVFPERFGELMNIMRASATDMEYDDPDWPLRQTLVTSHSPLLLDVVPRESIVFLETASRVGDGGTSRVTRPRRLLGHGEHAVRRNSEIPPMSETELDEFRSPIAGPT